MSSSLFVMQHFENDMLSSRRSELTEKYGDKRNNSL